MKLVLNLAVLCALVAKRGADAAGGGTFYTYFEQGGLGPSNWALLEMENNQCSGTNGASGYGQSPVAIRKGECVTSMSEYEFEAGNCKWDDLDFSISNNGVKVEPKGGNGCSFGRMKIPAKTTWFNALQFHIHTYSEHSIDGVHFPAELHVVHQEENKESFAVFGMMIDKGTIGDHDTFEWFLRGWEAKAASHDLMCPSEAAVGLRALVETDTVQEKVQCKPVGNGMWTDNWTSRRRTEEATEAQPETPVESTESTKAQTVAAPSVNFPDGTPDLYKDLPRPDFGTFTYKGGLTTPPCTEIVNWNLLDVPMYISESQLKRLEYLILCYVDTSTCKHATVADEKGSTSRPPQRLQGRSVIQRCPNGRGEQRPDVGVQPEEIPTDFGIVDDDQFDPYSSAGSLALAAGAVAVGAAGAIAQLM